MNGNYFHIDSGKEPDGVQDLIGAPYKRIYSHYETTAPSPEKTAKLVKDLTEAQEKRNMLSCSSKNYATTPRVSVTPGHAHIITRVFDL